MSEPIMDGSISHKIIMLFYSLRTLHFPLMEYIDKMQRASPFLSRPKIVHVEIKFTQINGKEEKITFDLFELENIEILANLKKQIFKMQGSKKELINKIRDMKDEVDMLENMETV